MSTLDTDSETAVTPTPAKPPTEPVEPPAEAAEQPTEVAEQPADEPTEKPAEPTEQPAAVTEEPTEPTEPAEPAEPVDAPTETVEAVEEASEKPADEPAEEPTEAATEKPAEEPTEAAAEKPADEPAEEPTEAATTAPAENTGLRSRRMLVPAVLAALALGSAIAVGVLGWQAYSDARSQRAQAAALEAAKAGTVQVLSYDSKTLDADLARSRTLISGAFASKFEELAGSVIEPAVKQQNLGTKATVARSAVIDAQPDQVRALLFVNQTTTVGSDPAPHTASNQVRVTMTWTDGHWLISDMQPL